MVVMAGSTTNGIKNKNAKTDNIAVVPATSVERCTSKLLDRYRSTGPYLDIKMCRTWPFRGTSARRPSGLLASVNTAIVVNCATIAN